MVSLKRQIYGLSILRPYRLWRAWQTAQRQRTVREGFSLASYDMAFTDDWERHERVAVARLLPDCVAFIDVGANNGFYSLLASHLGKPVVAAEPDTGNLIVLRQNTAGRDIEIYAGAISDRAGAVDLFGDGDMASFDPKWQGVGEHFKQSVPAITLDELIGDRWPGELLFIKVDVEGAEAHVLRGAEATLARDPKPYWLIETFQNLPTGAINDAHGEALQLMLDYHCEEISAGNYLFSSAVVTAGAGRSTTSSTMVSLSDSADQQPL